MVQLLFVMFNGAHQAVAVAVQLASVLASALLWARLGTAAQLALNSQALTLDQLVSDSEDDENERDEHNNDMNASN